MEILHIADRREWAAAHATGEYRVSGKGMTYEDEGFIHCSFPEQVAGTLEKHYAGDDRSRLVLLVMDSEAIETEGVPVRVEGGFPHVYGPLQFEWVTELRPLAP